MAQKEQGKKYTKEPCCYICGWDSLERKFVATDRNFGTTSQQFVIMECLHCGVSQTVPQPSPGDLHKYYPDVYYPREPAIDIAYDGPLRRNQLDKLKIIQRHRQSGRLLDVGCGIGAFMREAARSGFNVEGVEFSDLAASIGRNHWGLNIVTGDILSEDYANDSFDVVTCWQVLEHVCRPHDVIAKIARVLKPGGQLVIAVPNMSSFQAKIFRARWYHLEIPRHLFHFTPRTLSNIVEDHGFKVMKIDYTSREHNGSGFLGSIIRYNLPNESLIHKAFRKTAGKFVTDCLGYGEGISGRGGIFTLAAVKS